MNNLYDRFHKRLSNTSPDKHNEEFILFMISFLHCLRGDDHKETQYDGARQEHYAERVLEWIEHNYKLNFSLEKLSKELHLSPYYVSRLFKEATGSSIREYVISRRIKEACFLLRATEIPIIDICYEIGWKNPPYFSKVFKKYVGLTPKQFRDALENQTTFHNT